MSEQFVHSNILLFKKRPEDHRTNQESQPAGRPLSPNELTLVLLGPFLRRKRRQIALTVNYGNLLTRYDLLFDKEPSINLNIVYLYPEG